MDAPTYTKGAMVQHDTAWYFDGIPIWMIYPTSLREMLLQDVLTSTFGGICEGFENSFGALMNLF